VSRYGLHGKLVAQHGQGDGLAEHLLIAGFAERQELTPLGGKGLRRLSHGEPGET
jgi:hypothetical protein